MTQTNSNFAIILAAGASRRMGTCKTALPWLGNRTLLQYQAQQFLEAGFTPIVVLGWHNRQRQQDCPPGCQVTVNQIPKRGKTSSIQVGLQALPPKWTNLFVSAVDQPRSSYIYQRLSQIHQEKNAPITAPAYQGKLGHPLLFSYSILPDLNNIGDRTLGLRQIVQKYYGKIIKVEFPTSEVLVDLNTPTSYRMELEIKNKSSVDSANYQT